MRVMRRVLSPPFQTLQWRLMLTYTVVTVGAVLLIQLTVLGVAATLAVNAADLPSIIQRSLDQSGPQVAPYLVGAQPDQAGLRRWVYNYTNRSPYHQWPDNGGFVIAAVGSASLFAVIDTHGVIIASNGSGGVHGAAPGLNLLAALPAQGAATAQAALTAQGTVAQMAQRMPDGRIVTAAPIRASDGRLLGALVFIPDTTAMRDHFFHIVVASLLPSSIVLTVVVSLIGTVFGFFTARGLTRRLRGLTRAADAWSQGDFAITARDPSNDELGQLARDLNRMATHLQNLVHDRQQLAIVEERNRLARDLHDSVKQQIFATAMQLATTRTLLDRDVDAGKRHLAEAERLVSQAQHELTTLIGELRPAALEDKGLAQAIREQVAMWSRQTGISAETRMQGEQPTPLETEQALYRVTQEALSNIARHSGATTVDVALSWEAEALTLTIRDDGRGFDVTALQRASKGLGLRSMRERIAAAQGTLAVESHPGGTVISARIPLTDAAKQASGAMRRVSGAPERATQRDGVRL